MIDSSKKAKLRWRAKRGMLELDLILAPFVDHYFDQLKPDQIYTLEELMKCDDPTLFDWLMGYSQPSDKELKDLIEIIKLQHSTR